RSDWQSPPPRLADHFSRACGPARPRRAVSINVMDALRDLVVIFGILLRMHPCFPMAVRPVQSPTRPRALGLCERISLAPPADADYASVDDAASECSTVVGDGDGEACVHDESGFDMSYYYESQSDVDGDCSFVSDGHASWKDNAENEEPGPGRRWGLKNLRSYAGSVRRFAADENRPSSPAAALGGVFGSSKMRRLIEDRKRLQPPVDTVFPLVLDEPSAMARYSASLNERLGWRPSPGRTQSPAVDDDAKRLSFSEVFRNMRARQSLAKRENATVASSPAVLATLSAEPRLSTRPTDVDANVERFVAGALAKLDAVLADDFRCDMFFEFRHDHTAETLEQGECIRCMEERAYADVVKIRVAGQLRPLVRVAGEPGVTDEDVFVIGKLARSEIQMVAVTTFAGRR
ncbi:uncharacterized protein V1510DRAFT_433530, partial [Dipodascopsis tothii]|uniref:uncharacterized protein n=1 Tax=Dipodascopsis tothii TaxID=44089 RepID=UPI0034CF23B6